MAQLFSDIWEIITTAEYRNYLLQGFLNTLILTLFAAIIGLVIGFIVAIIKIFAKDNKYLKIPAIICNLYTTIIRGTPVALQLFVMVFAILAIPGFKVTAVIITFGINSGAYVSESIRAGILSVDKGQMEAGRALGLSKLKTMIKIIFPQAIKNVLPSIGNELIMVIKETSLASTVDAGIGELMSIKKQITSATFINIPPFIVIAVMYFVVTFSLSKAVRYIERRLEARD